MIDTGEQATLFIGTMGFGYNDWRGAFYPPEMPAQNYLSYYSRVFNCVEIDSTFYGTPQAITVRRWDRATPAGFMFCAKAPKMITHQMGLKNARARMFEFSDNLRGLGDKLGAILLQFPPSFKASQMNVLADFLADLPTGIRFSVEFRDQSWYIEAPALKSLLNKFGVCWTATEYPGLPEQIHITTDFIYVRWIGKHGSFQRHDQERIDRSKELGRWHQNIMNAARQVGKVFGFFNNDYAGFAAGTALGFMKLAGMSGFLPQQPRQIDLF